jgi:hypothetical protein
MFKKPRTWTDSLDKRPKQKKMEKQRADVWASKFMLKGPKYRICQEVFSSASCASYA